MTDADWSGPVGATFPAVIQHGIARSAANVDKSWIDTDVDACFTKATPSATDVYVLNDADAAGIAEARFGAAKGVPGVVILLTFGTGIGSALLVDGRLVPNTELGHLELDGHDAEKRAAASVRDEHKMSYKEWAKRVQRYMAHVERLFTPDLFVVGGGVSKDARQMGAAARAEDAGQTGRTAQRRGHRRRRDRSVRAQLGVVHGARPAVVRVHRRDRAVQWRSGTAHVLDSN